MLTRYSNVLALLVLMVLFSLAQVAFAQADDTVSDAGETEADDAAESDDDDMDDADNEDGDETEDEDEDSGMDGEDTDSEKASADDLELDYAALGKMNPEEVLQPQGGADKSVINVNEDWTQRNLEIFEVHGYFRVRPGLYNKFFIRNDPALFPLDANREEGCSSQDKCKTLAGADMRFLLAPTINLSEEVRINSELIFFDNMMLGSTPSYAGASSGANTVATGAVMGHTQGGVPSDFFTMNRVWGEMEGPIGHLRFGRMPEHWGTGMLYNSGDGLNDDLGDSVDRISFAFRMNGWMIMPAFDFPNEGLALNSRNGRPFDVSQLDEGYRVVGVLAYQHEKEDQDAMLKRGDWLINTGLHFSYRSQSMEFQWNEDPDANSTEANPIVTYDRGMWMVTPDLWFQFLQDTFHLELEIALHAGQLDEPGAIDSNMSAMKILSYGGVLQADYGLLSNQLRLGFEFGFASGDKQVKGNSAPTSFDQDGDSKFSVFSFNPAYGVSQILYRHILGSVSGTYYFKPWLRYDFLKAAMGKQLGVQLDMILARAVFKESTISESSANLGFEVNAQVDFVTADRFHASLKYGILFPLNGFKGTYEWSDGTGDHTHPDTNLTIPQTLQLLMGITF